jgi:hypothetical protein
MTVALALKKDAQTTWSRSGVILPAFFLSFNLVNFLDCTVQHGLGRSGLASCGCMLRALSLPSSFLGPSALDFPSIPGADIREAAVRTKRRRCQG